MHQPMVTLDFLDRATEQYADANLAGYKQPTSVDIVDELPGTATGKVRKTALRERHDSD